LGGADFIAYGLDLDLPPATTSSYTSATSEIKGGAASTILPSLTVFVTSASFLLSIPFSEPSESDLFVCS